MTTQRLVAIAAVALLGAACSTNMAGLSARDGATDHPAIGAGGVTTGSGGATVPTGSGGNTGLVLGTGGGTSDAGDAPAGTGGSGAGGRGLGGVVATGGAGSGGRVSGTGGAGNGGASTGAGGAGTGGFVRGSGGAGSGGLFGAGGEVQGNGGSIATSRGGATGRGGSGAGGIQGTGGLTVLGTGGVGAGGTSGTGTTCGGRVCTSDQFCCGPPDCGYCANILTGPNCQQACGTSACGPTGAPCQPGEICLNLNVSMGPRNTITTKCVANPCGTETLACDCAGTVCTDANAITQCSQAEPAVGALMCIGGGVCASPDTPIATPEGNRPIADLRRGDLVYSEHQGAIVAVPLLEVVRRPVQGHVVVHLVTASGVALDISAPHPTADGRKFADLKVGDMLDGDPILSREVVAYPYAFTYDILPASSTGTYVAAGHLIGSTLQR